MTCISDALDRQGPGEIILQIRKEHGSDQNHHTSPKYIPYGPYPLRICYLSLLKPPPPTRAFNLWNSHFPMKIRFGRLIIIEHIIIIYYTRAILVFFFSLFDRLHNESERRVHTGGHFRAVFDCCISVHFVLGQHRRIAPVAQQFD